MLTGPSFNSDCWNSAFNSLIMSCACYIDVNSFIAIFRAVGQIVKKSVSVLIDAKEKVLQNIAGKYLELLQASH